MRFNPSIFLIISMLLSAGCQKYSTENVIAQEPCEGEEQYLYEFTIGLSKAVANSEEIRSFIKNKALEKFDRDNDVFYAFVKNEKVNDTATFRQSILPYFESEQSLCDIEGNLPLLNIFIPDLTWIKEGSFCPESWDTSSPEVVTTYMYGEVCKYVYYNGLFVTELEGAVPACAALIVKNNERLEYHAGTKGISPEYKFISDAFDGTKDIPKTKYSHPFAPETYYINEPEDGSDNISFQDMNIYFPEAATAYELFKNNPYACQRDYVCYGMTSTNTVGILRRNIQDKIIRFKINPNALSSIADDAYGNSNETSYRSFYSIDDNGNANFDCSDATMINRLWGDGNLELNIQVNSGNNPATLYVVNVYLKDCFTVNAKVDYWHSTMIKWYRDWEVSYNPSSGIKAKWVYLTDNIMMPRFDLGPDGRSSYSVQVSEHDSGAEIQQSKSFSKNHTVTTSAKIGFDVSIDTEFANKYELGYTDSDTETNSESLSVKWNQNDDNLGSAIVYYDLPYICNSDSGSQYYVSYPISTGAFTFTLMPVVLW